MSEGFYVGETLDDARDRTGEQVHIDPSDFTTHGVVLGMTGSGKTGLGVVVLEEALRQGIPAIILDPKGDLGNLLLTFPSLASEEFEPWVDPAEAAEKGLSVPDFASRAATKWRNGLGGWGLGTDDVTALRRSADLQLLTPGSTSGNPVSLLGSLQAPDLDWETESETIRDEIAAWVTGLLGMVDIDADPLTSREHILISNVIEAAWKAGRSLDLPTLLGQIHRPPLRKLGVFDVDTFFPENDRMKLVMRLNALVASPSFAAWLEGPSMDIDSLLRAPDGRPRGSVLALSHLSEKQRQFVVTLVLSRAVSWMRRQPGTGSLRALIYLDEAFGFAPPTAEPPTKRPLLTLLKQARAHGLGVIMATQNPVDLDYKVMSNAGTWFIGRLQTQRDKARILEAMKSSSGEVDVKEVDALVGSLGKRQFLWWSAKRPAPTLFTSRWAMSYLRGPLTRSEVGRFKRDVEPERTTEDRAALPESPTEDRPVVREPQPEGPRLADNESSVRPEIADNIETYFLDRGAPWADELGLDVQSDRWQAAVACRVHLTYRNTKAELDHTEEWECIWFPVDEYFDAESGYALDYDDRDLRQEAPGTPIYVVPTAPIQNKTWWKRVGTELRTWLRRTQEIEIFQNKPLKLYSRIGETQEEFNVRCQRVGEMRADDAIAKLRESAERRFVSARTQIANAERALTTAQAQLESRKRDEWVSGAGSIISAFFGGRSKVRGMASGVRGISRRRGQVNTQNTRVDSAEDKVQERYGRLHELEMELQDRVTTEQVEWADKATEVEAIEVGVSRSGVEIDELVLVWVPVS
jgi:hypothetical protein